MSLSVDSGSSSTFDVVGKSLFNISYVDGTHSDGDYFSDVFSIGGSSVSNLTMGLGSDTDIPYGLVGIGYKADEASLASGVTYDNLPIVMLKEGVINTIAYSLWLNDLGMLTFCPLINKSRRVLTSPRL